MTAADVLKKHYGDSPIVLPVDVGAIAASEGIEVFGRTFAGTYRDSVYGYIEKVDGKVRIVLNMSNVLTRRRFTAAHELGHYFLHHSGEDLEYLDMRSTMSSPEEVEANRFAAELLMPEKELKDEHDRLLFPTVDELARRFCVSPQAMRIRLSALNLSAI